MGRMPPPHPAKTAKTIRQDEWMSRMPPTHTTKTAKPHPDVVAYGKKDLAKIRRDLYDKAIRRVLFLCHIIQFL